MKRTLSFRGLIAHGAQERISLGTIRGETGYQVTKFQVMQEEPGELSVENTVKIYKVLQSVINNTVDFSDSTLLGVALWQKSSGNAYNPTDSVIFDNEIFNQDIYITQSDVEGATASSCNYYIELEQMDLALDEATVATLKDIRNND